MNYQYIEQLVERYFEAQTSVEEEQILKIFFSQTEVPQHLRRWQPLFSSEAELQRAEVSADFEERVMQKIGNGAPCLKPKPAPTNIGLSARWKRPGRWVAGIAAVLAVAFMGTAVAHLVELHERSKAPVVVWDYNPESYKDSYDNPQIAYDESMEALKLLQEKLSTIVNVDSTKVTSMK